MNKFLVLLIISFMAFNATAGKVECYQKFDTASINNITDEVTVANTDFFVKPNKISLNESNLIKVAYTSCSQCSVDLQACIANGTPRRQCRQDFVDCRELC